MTLKEAREKVGITQIDLAEKSGISLAYVRQIEQGQASGVSVRVKIRLAKALGIDTEKVFPGAEAVWTGRPAPRAAEDKEFNDKLAVLYNDLMTKADPNQQQILGDDNNWIGFGEVLWIMRTLKEKLPKGVL